MMGTATTGLVYIPDHAERAERALLTQHRDRARIPALALALGAAAQAAEDMIFDLIVGRTVDASTGTQLDQWGRVVGEQRGGLGDTDYRRFITARIAANIADGTQDEIIRIFALITAPSDVRLLPMYPAGVQLHAVRRAFLAERVRRRVRRMMEDIRPAGVTFLLVEAVDGYFGFDGNPTAAGYGVGKLARVM